MRIRAVYTLAAASSLLATGLAVPSVASAATPARVGVSRTAPAWLPRARNLGHASATAATTFKVYLSPRGGLANLQAQVTKVATPGSGSYRKFISTAQYHASYDPTGASVASVTKWLTSNHLAVTGVAQYNQYLQVSGTVAAAQAALGVTINSYQHDGMTVQANSSTLTVPADVAGSVLTVVGVDTTPNLAKPAAYTPAPPSPSFVNARPCSLYYGQLAAKTEGDYRTPLPTFNGKVLPYSVCGYTGVQLRTAYEGDTTLDGSGITIGVIDAYASPTILKDVKHYAVTHGDGDYLPGQYTQDSPPGYTHTGSDPDTGCFAPGWFGEQTLDIEVAHAMAPAANIRFYGAKSCYDEDLQYTLTKAVNENRVDMISNSYGEPDDAHLPSGTVSSASIAAFEEVVLQGELQGISFMFSSGDNGDEQANTGIKQTDNSASDPFVTAVGGTSDAIGADGKFVFQTGWGTEKYVLSADGKSWSSIGFTSGAGGGYSTLFNRPTYQNGVVSVNAPAGRAVPDVAMTADPTTGFLVGQTETFPNGSVRYGEYRIGGTSVASPEFTGMTALLLQHAGGRLGFLNPLIYGQAKSKAKTFTDIKGAPADAGNVRADYVNGNDPSAGIVYSVRAFNRDSSLKVSSGWDPVTGIGAPNSGWLTSVVPAS